MWRTHFATLSTPYDDPSYDQLHFDNVNSRVNELNKRDSGSVFLETPFDIEEVQKAVSKLKINKAGGYDGICAEHIQYGGSRLVDTLTSILNLINQLEYVPINFRRGTQVTLFKGKNLCSTDTNNYRGITLLLKYV